MVWRGKPVNTNVLLFLLIMSGSMLLVWLMDR